MPESRIGQHDYIGQELQEGDLMIDGRGRILRFLGLRYQTGELADVHTVRIYRDKLVDGAKLDYTRHYYCVRVEEPELLELAAQPGKLSEHLRAWHHRKVAAAGTAIDLALLEARAEYRKGLPRP